MGGTTRYSMLATTFDGEGLGENLEHPGEESVHLGLIRFYEIMKFLEIDFSAFEAVREIINQREGVVVEPRLGAEIGLEGGGHADNVAPIFHDADFGFGLETWAAHLHVGFVRLDIEFRGELF